MEKQYTPPYRYAYGDEAGNTGFKFDAGASQFFVMALILTNDPQPIRQRMIELRQELRLASDAEFSFHSTPVKNRVYVLAALNELRWMARVVSIDKRLLLMNVRESAEFYAFAFVELLERLPLGELENTIVHLDAFGAPKRTLRAVRRQFKRAGLHSTQPRWMQSLSFVRSEGEPLIQAADFIAGSVYRRVTEKERVYYDLIDQRTLHWVYRAKRNPPT